MATWTLDGCLVVKWHSGQGMSPMRMVIRILDGMKPHTNGHLDVG